MKLGYLFIPPAGGQSRRPGHAAAMRAPLAKALGFSEFYAPLTPSEDTPGPHATERQSLLHILPNPPEQLRPQLVLVDGQSRDRGRPAPGPVAAPVSHAAQARMHSARGRAPLSVSWSDTDMLARHWAAHVTGCTHAGRCARPQDWRVARTVIVDPDAARAEATAKHADSPCRAYYRASLGENASDTEVDAQIDACVLYGTPATVLARLHEMTQVSASFGTLTFVDHDWPDVARARQSMRLFAETLLTTHQSQTQRNIRKLEFA